MKPNFDQVLIHFDANQQSGLYWILAFIMFGVALQIRLEDFKLLWVQQKSVWAGLLSQFFLLPLLTFVLVRLMEPHPSLALGMFLVAACPGGNISNFMSAHAQANIPLSVSLTAFSSGLAVFLTPLNFMFYASLYEPTALLLTSIHVDGKELLKLQVLMLVLPLFMGMYLAHKYHSIAKTLARLVHPLSLGIFILLVSVAFWNNRVLFLEHFEVFFFWVLVHNAIALCSGYGLGLCFGLDKNSCRTLAIETGIQNSGLGLVIVFSFFSQLGGMAMITAWWGIWHIISGLAVSTNYRYRPLC